MSTVLITGSSRGIGLAIAERFAENKDNIVLNCCSGLNEMNEALVRLKKNNVNVIGIQTDVSKYDDAAEMFKQIEKTFGYVDVLINNAGISHVGLFNLTIPSEWKRIVDVNLYSVLNCSHLAVQHMIHDHKGVIINISSVWGNVGASCEAVYSASKGGVNSFTKALAKELGPCGIRVNAVSCGVIDTRMNSNLSETEKAALSDEIPMMRLGTTKEVSDTVFYLASDKASYITGQIITVDGGFI